MEGRDRSPGGERKGIGGRNIKSKISAGTARNKI